MRQVWFYFLLLPAVCLLRGALFAQTASSDSVGPVRDVQLTFITPLGTNGIAAVNTVNRISLNVIGGISGGVEGFEAASVFNITRGRVRGVQMAGMLNTARTAQDAIQLSGFLNFNQQQEGGIALAGFANIAPKGMAAVQGSGFLNVAQQTDLQAAGFANVAQSVKGIQLAGFANVAQSVQGAQVSGFINVAKNVKGIQLGIINVCDSIDGVPIGLINIVRKNRFDRWEIAASEGFHVQVAYKIGVPRFYTMLSGGVQFDNGQDRWGLGMGLGTQRALGRRIFSQTELISHTIYEDNGDDFWETDLNLLNQLKMTFSVQLAPHFELFAGPTLNVLVSDYDQPDGTPGSGFPRYTMWKSNNSNTSVQSWIGFTAGMRF